MIHLDPYKAYAECKLTGGNPASLVVALYEGAIEAVRSAKKCLASGDIMARGRATTKAVNILTELLVSLNHEEGGTVSRNLQQLYLYSQKRLLEAHTRQTREPLDEVEKLLSTLFEAWQKVALEQAQAETQLVRRDPSVDTDDSSLDDAPYGPYFVDSMAAAPTFSLAC